MGRKRKRHLDMKAAAAAEAGQGGEAAHERAGQVYNNTPPDPPSRLLALQPGGGIAMAYGKRLSIVPSG